MSSKISTSVTRAVDILKSLGTGHNRLSDIALDLSLSKSTVHRLLSTLEQSGLVIQDPIRRRYYLGQLFLSLSSNPHVSHQNLVVSAFGEMERLMSVSKETVVLHIRTGTQRVCLEEIPSPESIKYTSGKGFIAPIYTGAAGKILLSKLDDNELGILLKHIELTSIGPNTITEKEILKKELMEVRKNGYATSFGERVHGSACISVAIENYICPVALSILGPDNRFSSSMMLCLRELKISSARISKRIMELLKTSSYAKYFNRF